nr:beta galactosidase jelly roll domain-containing protein [Prolixibacteraceae bacterium]
MKTKIILIAIIAFLMLHCSSEASNWSRISDLEGWWHFTVGDDENWAKQNVDVTDWDKIIAPRNWDDYYSSYNGYGWYRKTFDINWMPEEGEVALFLGYVDDVDEVFINGVKVGQTGSFLPNFKTAYGDERKYYLPIDLLKKEDNVIAVRVYDAGGPGGILRGNKIGIYHDNDYSLLSVDMSGSWKFSIHRERGFYDVDFDDSAWNRINVPGTWESQGYPGHDGYAYYRTEFTIPKKLENESLYLVLGKIDDFDKVYLNGEAFARTEYLDKYSRYRKYNSWQLYRVYPIPANKFKNINVIAVEVKDEQLGGGIYEGPIGIMTKRDAEVILER